MKKVLSFILILVLNTSLTSLSDTNIVYNNNDISALQKIYNHNADALNYWDLSNPDDIGEIEWECINNTYKLISIDLSSTSISGKIDLSDFEYIDYYNFSNTNIEEIILSKFSNEIPSKAFENCSELEYINIPESISIIENNAFKNCSNLKSVILNNSNTTVMSSAFSGCVSLECVINANNIKSIGRNAFSNCDKLVFYDKEKTENYINSYTQNMNYLYSTDTNSSVTGYVSIMTNGKNQSPSKYPYKIGNAYLYDENNNLIENIALNSNGEFKFDNLSIGRKYKLVIDGKFAIARDCYFIATKNDNIISNDENAIPVVTCDFNQDGIVTNADAQILYSKCASCKPEEIDLYSLNGDNTVSAGDAVTIYSIMAYFNGKGYTDWN